MGPRARMAYCATMSRFEYFPPSRGVSVAPTCKWCFMGKCIAHSESRDTQYAIRDTQHVTLHGGVAIRNTSHSTAA